METSHEVVSTLYLQNTYSQDTFHDILRTMIHSNGKLLTVCKFPSYYVNIQITSQLKINIFTNKIKVFNWKIYTTFIPFLQKEGINKDINSANNLERVSIIYVLFNEKSLDFVLFPIEMIYLFQKK